MHAHVSQRHNSISAVLPISLCRTQLTGLTAKHLMRSPPLYFKGMCFLCIAFLPVGVLSVLELVVRHQVTVRVVMVCPDLAFVIQ